MTMRPITCMWRSRWPTNESRRALPTLVTVWQKPLLAGLCAGKPAYGATVIMAAWHWANMDVEEFYNVNQCWPHVGEPVFTSHFATWDAAPYLYLREAGWHHGLASCVLYPLRASLIGLTRRNRWDASLILTQRPINSM